VIDEATGHAIRTWIPLPKLADLTAYRFPTHGYSRAGASAAG
jgi:hypothetical protein